MKNIIYKAKTLEEAITKACVEQGISSEDLKYQIVENGSQGFLGIGAKPFVISVLLQGEDVINESSIPDNSKVETLNSFNSDSAGSEEVLNLTSDSECSLSENIANSSDADNCSCCDLSSECKNDTFDNCKSSAVDFLSSVLKKMNVDASVTVDDSFLPDELGLVISGDNMGVIIGKRGQTLDALQYLTGQVVNKNRDSYLRIKLDTENYRKRRKETLESLAKNVADKVSKTKRPVVLEPMNPYERRIIHSVLQTCGDISTRSEGEEPYRHIVVYPVKH